MMRAYHSDGSSPQSGEVFVFGSNLSGIHGGGAARAAHRLYGAKWGFADGRTGECYAIPTVAEHISGPISVAEIAERVSVFLRHAEDHPDQRFFVTRIGCGLAGHADADIAPLFKDAPLNCSLPEPWRVFCALKEGTEK